MNTSQLASAMFLEPWGISWAGFHDFYRRLENEGSHQKTDLSKFSDICSAGELRGAADDPVGPAWRNRAGEIFCLHPQIEKQGKIAYRTVSGVIGRNLSLIDLFWYDGVDIAILEEQMEKVRDDDEIETLILNFNTPGGRVQGIEAAGLAIREVSDSGKNVIGYTDGQCCSCGYFLAAACDEFLAQLDAVVGSISTICAGIDDSRRWEMLGLKLELFATGKHKGIGHPGKPWTDEDREQIRSGSKVIDDVFKGFVAKHRGLTPDLMEGTHWYARAAPAGLIDGFAKNINQVIQASIS